MSFDSFINFPIGVIGKFLDVCCKTGNSLPINGICFRSKKCVNNYVLVYFFIDNINTIGNICYLQ